MHDTNIFEENRRRNMSLRRHAPSSEQKEAINAILRWRGNPINQVFYLNGCAGTGKTEAVIYLQDLLPNIQYASFTGKSASELRQRGAANAKTLHSLLYYPPRRINRGSSGETELEFLKRRRDLINHADFVVVDECSMIDEQLGDALVATGASILAVGDRLQLPPPAGHSFFDGEPDFTLTKIHRQARNSQPLRTIEALLDGRPLKVLPFDTNALMSADIVICAFEATRWYLTRFIRRELGLTGVDPVVGDRVCCYRNSKRSGVLNGTLWSIEDIAPHQPRRLPSKPVDPSLLDLRLVDDFGNQISATGRDDFFHGHDPRKAPHDKYDVFSYGYVLTCHKAQGSEWDQVVVIDETASPGFQHISGDLLVAEYRRRWLYTAVTRAKKKVTLMGAPR